MPGCVCQYLPGDAVKIVFRIRDRRSAVSCNIEVRGLRGALTRNLCRLEVGQKIHHGGRKHQLHKASKVCGLYGCLARDVVHMSFLVGPTLPYYRIECSSKPWQNDPLRMHHRASPGENYQIGTKNLVWSRARPTVLLR